MTGDCGGEPAAKRARMEDGSAAVIVDEVNKSASFRKYRERKSKRGVESLISGLIRKYG